MSPRMLQKASKRRRAGGDATIEPEDARQRPPTTGEQDEDAANEPQDAPKSLQLQGGQETVLTDTLLSCPPSFGGLLQHPRAHWLRPVLPRSGWA